MVVCPLCTEYRVEAAVGIRVADALSQHLESDHAPHANSKRPWRCTLCPGRKRNYASSAALAKHMLKDHEAGPVHAEAPAEHGPSIPAGSSVKEVLGVPCLPWLPRPKWWSRPPTATVLLATWNLEVFSHLASDSRTAAIKVANIATTLLDWCRAEGPQASVVVALQEVFQAEAVPFLADHLSRKEAGPGGSGRTWHCATSGALGNNSERAAFLWSSPPPSAVRRGARGSALLSCIACGGGAGAGGGGGSSGPQAPLHADPASCFQMLQEGDRQAVIRSRQQELEAGRFLRSPFYGLFRVGFANLLVVNVHLASEIQASNSELAALHGLAAAIQQPNRRLFRRYSLRGLLRGSQPRGVMAVLGDFNNPMGPATAPQQQPQGTAPSRCGGGGAGAAEVPAAAAGAGGGAAAGAGGGAAAPQQAGKAPCGPLSAALAARGHVVVAASGSQSGAGMGVGAGGGGGAASMGTEGAVTGQGQHASRVGSGRRKGAGRHKGGGVNEEGAKQGTRKGPGGAAPAELHVNGSWAAFLRQGWFNALARDGVLQATNWGAKKAKAYDAVCLPQAQAGLVTGHGVCAPPAFVDPSQPNIYPNHKLCWVRLDLGPLQRAPGKVRPLLQPELVAAAGGHATVAAKLAG